MKKCPSCEELLDEDMIAAGVCAECGEPLEEPDDASDEEKDPDEVSGEEEEDEEEEDEEEEEEDEKEED